MINLKTVLANTPWSQIFVTLVISLSAFSCGLQLSWTSQTIPILISENSPIPMTLEEASYLTVISYVTAVLFAPVIGKLVDVIGRKYTYFVMTVPQLIGWITIGFTTSPLVLYCARAVCGLSDGGLLIVLPIYIGEVLDPKLRGGLGCVTVFSLYFGELYVNLIGSYASISTTAFACSVIPALFLITFCFCPETPYFLIMKGRHKEAENTLKKVRTNTDTESEFHQIELDVKRQMSESKSIKDLLFKESNRKALLIAIGLRTAHQLSGITPFTMYTQYIFDNSGSSISGSTSTMIFLSLQAIVVLIVSCYIDRWGRRPLIIISSFGCTIALAMQSIYFCIAEYTLITISTISWLPVLIMMFYIIVSSVGFAMVPTLMLSELFSVNMKGKALGFMIIYYMISIPITSKIFQLLVSNFGMFPPFLFFTICCFCGSIFCYCCVPETKGKTLEEIQQLFIKKQIGKINS